MVAPDRIWLIFAVTISLLVHLLVVTPLSSWLNRSFAPRIYDEGFEIQLLEEEKTEIFKADLLEEPKADLLEEPKADLLEEPKAESVVEPEAEPLEEPKAELWEEPEEDPVMAEPPPRDNEIDKVFQDLPEFTKNLSVTAVEDDIILPEKEDPGLKDGEDRNLDEQFFEKLLDQPLYKTAEPAPEPLTQPDEILETEELIPPETIVPKDVEPEVIKEVVTLQKIMPLTVPESEKNSVKSIESKVTIDQDKIKSIEPLTQDAVEIVEPKSDVFAALTPEPTNEPSAKITPQAITEVAPIIEPTTVTEADPIPEPTNVTKLESITETAPIAESVSMMETEPITETVPIAESASIMEAEPITETAPIAESASITETEPITETSPVTEVAPITEAELKKTSEEDIVASISPVFRVKPDVKKTTDGTPEIIKKSFRGLKPERTNEDNIQFSMNTYKWTFERYMENWAVDLSKWWSAPSDYRFGKVPDGGNVWVRVKLKKSGKLLGYKVFDSDLTAEMELSVIQALIGSLERPSLPETFPEEELIINWKFIYPPIDSQINLRQK